MSDELFNFDDLKKKDEGFELETKNNIDKAKKKQGNKKETKTGVNKIVGYCRVSTDKQDTDRQVNDIVSYCKQNNLGAVSFETETISSRKTDRLIFVLIDRLLRGDKVIVTELSRLGRSMIEINEIISKSIKKGIDLRVVSGNMIIDESIQSQAITFALGISAQVERDLISERTKSGLKAVKEKGVKLGRRKGQSKLENQKDKIKELLNLGMNQSQIARFLNVNRGTLLNYLNQSKLNV